MAIDMVNEPQLTGDGTHHLPRRRLTPTTQTGVFEAMSETTECGISLIAPGALRQTDGA